MSHSEIFSKVKRLLGVANFCEQENMSSKEGLEQLEEIEKSLSANREKTENISQSSPEAKVAFSQSSQNPSQSMRINASPLSANINIGIVGAGLAGLSCAYELQYWNLFPTIYEAEDRVGGRCFSLENFFPGQVTERGGEFIDTNHHTLRNYALEFGLETENLSKDNAETFFYFQNQHHSEANIIDEYRAFLPALQNELQLLKKPVAERFTSGEQTLDFINLKEYLESRGAGSLLTSVLDVVFTIEYGLESSLQSCLNLLLFIQNNHQSKWKPFGMFSDEQLHLVEGNEAIVKNIAAKIKRPIELGHQLVAIRKTPTGQIELTLQKGHETITRVHDIIVLTVPFSVLRHVKLDENLNLPPWKTFAIDNLLYGTNTKLMIGFQGPFWGTLGANGKSFSDLMHLQNTWESNPTCSTQNSAVLTQYSGGNLGASINPNAPEKEAKEFLKDLALVYPKADDAVIRTQPGNKLLIHLEHWPSNPLTKGSYTCNQPGYFTTIAGNEGKPVENLFFAGEHTNSFYEWQGFMEGAALSGIQAASDIIKLLS